MTLYERQALAMMHRLIYDFSDDFYAEHIQHSDSTLGIMVSGGTLATSPRFGARATRRLDHNQASPARERRSCSALNFYSYKGAVIVGSQLMHYSFKKRGPTGHRRNSLSASRATSASTLTRTATNAQGLCRARGCTSLPSSGIRRQLPIRGSIDPLAEMAENRTGSGHVHFHVDAAWGGPVLFSERHREKLAASSRLIP
jgi:glutamate decarboxylase